jgi:hypothetical protein
VSLTPVANGKNLQSEKSSLFFLDTFLPPVSTTLAKLVAKFPLVSLILVANLPLVSLIPAAILPLVLLTPVTNLPPMSLIPVVHFDLRISQRILEKI